MKRQLVALSICIAIFGSSLLNLNCKVYSGYKDGIYKVQDKPDYEGFYSVATMEVKGHKIISLDWKIYDQNGREFDETYEEVYEGNQIYKQQCRDDLAGGKKYVQELLEKQKLEDVDAISGATWMHGKFTNIIEMALKEAR